MTDLKLDLTETGTRYAHYVELRDLFIDGKDIIDNLSGKSSLDQMKADQLDGAIELINSRIDFLSDRIMKFNQFCRESEKEIETLFYQIRSERINEMQKEQDNPQTGLISDDNGESPASYSTK